MGDFSYNLIQSPQIAPKTSQSFLVTTKHTKLQECQSTPKHTSTSTIQLKDSCVKLITLTLKRKGHNPPFHLKMGHDFRLKNPKPPEAETGAGQHGVATAAACALLDLECVP